MVNEELITATFSIIHEEDSYKESKQFHLRNWCNAFSVLFSNNGAESLPFFLEVLSDDQCWERTDSMHPIKLNRRKAARNMVRLQNWKGRNNPLNNYDRYRLACWCCLEEDIAILFENFRQERGANTKESLKTLAMDLSRGRHAEPLTIYWSYIMGQCASDMQLEGKHIYEYGLGLAFYTYLEVTYVEAVEYFWNKIKTLPESVMKSRQKYEIMMTILLRFTGTRTFPLLEITEFCIGEITPDLYPELIKRDCFENGYYCILDELQNNLLFDQFQKLFDCFTPSSFDPYKYYNVLEFTGIREYPGYYACAAMALFLHVWRREGFDKHRSYAIHTEMKNHANLLVSLTKKNFMEALWAVMDKVKPEQMKVFMKSYNASSIFSILHERGERESLKKFFSYQNIADSLEIPSTSRTTIHLCSGKEICLDNLWAELDRANAGGIQAFMNSEQSHNICSALVRQRDWHLVEKFLSYVDIIKGIENSAVNINLDTGPEAKRRRTE